MLNSTIDGKIDDGESDVIYILSIDCIYPQNENRV
jgi:hypothetical protein